MPNLNSGSRGAHTMEPTKCAQISNLKTRLSSMSLTPPHDLLSPPLNERVPV
jgi:hypothetical protein